MLITNARHFCAFRLSGVFFILFVIVSDDNVTLALVEVEGFIVLTSLLITGDFNVDQTLKQTQMDWAAATCTQCSDCWSQSNNYY